MAKIIFIALMLGFMALVNSYLPKKDYSHVPKEYHHLVHFAEGAGY